MVANSSRSAPAASRTRVVSRAGDRVGGARVAALGQRRGQRERGRQLELGEHRAGGDDPNLGRCAATHRPVAVDRAERVAVAAVGHVLEAVQAAHDGAAAAVLHRERAVVVPRHAVARVLDRARVERPGAGRARRRAPRRQRDVSGREPRHLELEPRAPVGVDLDGAVAGAQPRRGGERVGHVERHQPPARKRQHVGERRCARAVLKAHRAARQRAVGPAVAAARGRAPRPRCRPARRSAERVQSHVGQPQRDLQRRAEALGHVGVGLVDRTAADRVVRVVAQQLAPGVAQLAQGIPGTRPGQHRERPQRLGLLQRALAALVVLLERHAGRVDTAQHVQARAAAELAREHGQVSRRPRDRRRVVREPRDLDVEVGPARAQVGHDLGQVVLQVGVVDAVAEEHVAERRVRAHGRLGAQDLLDPVGGVGAGLGLLGPARVTERGGGAVIDRLRQRQHLGPVRGDPAEAPAEALALVAQAAREHERVQAEPA